MRNSELSAADAESIQVLQPGLTRFPELIDLFLENGRVQLDNLIKASGVASRLGAAHCLLGSALTLGLPRLAEACRSATQLIESEDVALQSVRAEYERAVRALSESAGAEMRPGTPRPSRSVLAAVRELLVVDGSLVYRKAMASTMASHSDQVWTAGTRAEAAELLVAHPRTSLVLTGSLLPDSDGPSLLESVCRGEGPGPLGLLATASPSSGLARRARDSGAIAVLLKPTTAHDVLNAIGQHLASS